MIDRFRLAALISFAAIRRTSSSLSNFAAEQTTAGEAASCYVLLAGSRLPRAARPGELQTRMDLVN
jgi:hypothetical protein